MSNGAPKTVNKQHTQRNPLTHPLAKGTRVNVRNSTLTGKEIIEGEATIIAWSAIGGDHSYLVRFKGERKKFRRFVLPEHAEKGGAL